MIRCFGKLGCGLLMVLNVLDLVSRRGEACRGCWCFADGVVVWQVLGVTLLLIGTFTPSAVSQLNSMLAKGDDGSAYGILEDDADRDFIHDRFW